MQNKENNQEGGPASVSVASPRVSSVGAPSEGADHPQQQPSPSPQAYQATVFSDHLHWGGVQRTLHARGGDARSVSSAAADRDAQSVYDDVGGLDAHTEGDEHDEDDDGEVPEEITLTQVQGELRELPQLRHEPSAVESAFTGISAAGSLADVVDQLADQAVAGELSPRQAAAAIRSATAAREGLAGGSADDGSAGGAGGSSSAAAAVDALDGSDSVASLPHRSSIAPSDDGWHGASGLGGSSTADMMDSIPLEAEAPPQEALPEEAPEAAEAAAGEAAAAEDEAGEAAAEDEAGEAAAEPAAAEDDAGEPQPQEGQQAEEAAQQAEGDEEPALPESKSAHDVAAVLDAAEVPAVEEEPPTTAAAGEDAAGQDGGSSTAGGASAAATAAAAAAAAGVARKPSGSAYRSRLMQQLTASGSEDDITVYSSADIAGAPGQDPLSQAAAAQQAQQQPAAAADAAAPAAAGGRGGMQPLSIANGSDSGAAGGVMPTQDTAKALAAINAAASNAPAGDGGEAAAQSAPELLFPPQWYQTFKGLLYMDGVDSLGRPVVVLNADVVPPNMKASALVYIKAHLEPLVNQGDYVLVFTSRGHARLPSMWIMGAYRSLPRPFRKNVQHIVLVRPSAFLRTVLAFMRPFVSKKAHRKIKQVQSVHDIAAATEGEVTLASLGPAFSAELLAAEEEAVAAAAQVAGGGVAPAAGGSAGSSP